MRAVAPVERLFPWWTPFVYLLSPPFLALLLDTHPLTGRWDRYWPVLVDTWLSSAAIGGIIHALYTWVAPRWLRRAGSRLGALMVHGAVIVIAVGLGQLVAHPIALQVCRAAGIGAAYDESITRAQEIYASLIIASGLVGMIVGYESLRRHAREVELRLQRANAAAVSAELAELQARINPHFLFNSLNTVAGLIAEHPERAEATVERLADTFRYALDASRHRRVKLGRELDAVRDYLEIEAIRFDRLRWSIEVPDELTEIEVPPLVLQPLIENAVRHGASQNPAGGSVVVRARRDGSQLVLTVVDDGPGPGRSTHSGTQTSVRDLRERLKLNYGPAARLQITDSDGGGCIAEIAIPIEGDA